MTLRDYQHTWVCQVHSAWANGAQNVLGTMATGGGKTVCFCHIVRERDAPSAIVAHRQELVAQSALTLNREQVPHGIIAPDNVISQIVAAQMRAHGKSWYQPRAAVRVAGVDTLNARRSDNDRWFSQVKLVVIDEAHHVQAANKWGTVLTGRFPAAKGLFVTAHALRADGGGLGRALPGCPNDGLADALVVGPSFRTLIDRGFLCDYRLICPPESVDISAVEVGASGEFKADQLRIAVHKSGTIVGDTAANYMKFTPGALGLTFAVDIELAQEIAAAYRKLHVRAEIITGETPIPVRAKLMEKFRDRDILQLVSVDVLGEGTDVPAVEVITHSRHTNSFQTYAQQIGRGGRPMIDDSIFRQWDRYTDDQRKAYIAASIKPKFTDIDQVGNWQRHLPLPDMPRAYTLEKPNRRARKAPDDAIPLRTCLNETCYQPYERVLAACPHCGTAAPPPRGRGSPELVDGDLAEMDPAILAALRAAVARVDGAPLIPAALAGNPAAMGAVKRNHRERHEAQTALRAAIALWAGWQRHLGRDDTEIYKRFFYGFGIDVLTAQSINAQAATELEMKVRTKLDAANVVDATRLIPVPQPLPALPWPALEVT